MSRLKVDLARENRTAVIDVIRRFDGPVTVPSVLDSAEQEGINARVTRRILQRAFDSGEVTLDSRLRVEMKR
ncbi:MAG: hypothetical protein JKY41_13165 [Rhodobacteraceae bacterium]|nr:hypothetical protein [Paracoccaceae bacterium]